MSKATYNITNDKIKFYPEEIGRLPEEQYKKARKCGFVWWRGSKCFTAKWSPWAEDFVKSFGLTIEEDDTPDDVEARAERYEKYAERAEQNAEYAADRVANANTARRLRMAEGTLTSETEKAAYWHDRIAGAIAHARYKDRPDVIVRRILGLEKDLRLHRKYFEDLKEHTSENGTVYVWITNGGRGGHWLEKDKLPSIQKQAQRWIDHIEARLEYEREYLEAVGGDPREAVKDIGIGDVVEFAGEEWEVISAGSRNVILYNESRPDYLRRRRVERENVGKIIRKAEQPQKRKIRKAVAPEDGIAKGVTVTWRTWTDRGFEHFTTKCVSASPRTIRVELPDDPRFNGIRSRGETSYKIERRYAKPAEAVNG